MPETTAPMTARQEWRAMWPLPLVSMIGLSGSCMFAYSAGVFMLPITEEFGWQRAEFSAAFTIQAILLLFFMPASGWLADRFGSRRVVLAGIVPFALAFSLLALTGGSIWSWWALVAIVPIFSGLITPPVWVSAVVARFHASRGLALAISLGGVSLASLVYPLLAAFFTGEFGWRLGFPAVALTWLALVLPLTLLFYHGSAEVETADATKGVVRPGAYLEAVKSPTFLLLVFAAGIFASATYGVYAHLVPILHGNGLGMTAAAGLLSLLGMCAMIGRIVTGFLLDHMPTRSLAICVFLIPIVVPPMLLLGGDSLPVLIAAVIILGLCSGAENDIVAFLAARRFGQGVFASVYGVFTAVIALCSSLGPVTAGAFFDASGSYRLFLILLMPTIAVATVLMALVPTRPKEVSADSLSPVPASMG